VKPTSDSRPRRIHRLGCLLLAAGLAIPGCAADESGSIKAPPRGTTVGGGSPDKAAETSGKGKATRGSEPQVKPMTPGGKM
jgi:hypothetical protein